MITDKQRQRDFEYEADYQTKSRYNPEQWRGIISSGQIDESCVELLKMIYSSFNHVATLLQLSFHKEVSQEDVLNTLNKAGHILGEANELEPEVDFSGNEYWWYLFCWGKETDDKVLEFKLQPELSEAVSSLWPELEEAYYAFMNDAERSLQIRYSQEDAVWIAASVLLYEKYYRYPGITTDDILLMQYEVQTRAQRIFGQDVDTVVINQICNADERGHRYNYLRDMYKYYRVPFPGEFDGDRERPDPEELDYSAYIYSLFGYMTIEKLYDFISHEYAHLVDESYVDLTNANGFVRLAAFLSRQGGKSLSPDDTSEKAAGFRIDGADCVETFRMIGDSLIAEYPSFSYLSRGEWYLEQEEKIAPALEDRLLIESRKHTGAYVAIRTVTEGDNVNIETSLHLPWIEGDSADSGFMEDIREKCDKLVLMTSAPFQVEITEAGSDDPVSAGKKIRAFVLYSYDEFKTMKEEDIIGLFGGSLQIFASYYTDICQNYYPRDGEDASETPAADPDKETASSGTNTSLEDSLKAALGSRLTIRQGSDTPGPTVRYREIPDNPSTDYITKALQGVGSRQDSTENYTEQPKVSQGYGGRRETAEEPVPVSRPDRVKIPPSTHPDRADQSFRLFPKNTLIKGPMKTRKFHEAIMTTVGIIEGKDIGTLGLEPVPDILEHFKEYEEAGRILHIACPDLGESGYESFVENADMQDGIFKTFANRCGQGRYVVLMEEVDLNWRHLFGDTSVLLRPNRREGASSETIITLRYSGESFRLPSNLYIVGTCDSVVCEDTILSAVDYDFYIRPVSPEPGVLHTMRVAGISLERLMRAMNTRISYFLGPDYQLGEGFFLSSSERDALASLARAFREQILPILEKWFNGDIESIRYVLGDNGKTRNDTIFYREIPFRDSLFKGQLPDSFDTGRRIYELNEDAFMNPRSYITIYE